MADSPHEKFALIFTVRRIGEIFKKNFTPHCSASPLVARGALTGLIARLIPTQYRRDTDALPMPILAFKEGA